MGLKTPSNNESLTRQCITGAVAPAHPCARDICASCTSPSPYAGDFRFGESHQSHSRLRLRPQESRVPSSPRSPPRVPEGTVPVPAVDVRLAALHFPCSRLQVQGLPSLANPFSGAKSSGPLPISASPLSHPFGPAVVSVGIRLGVRRKTPLLPSPHCSRLTVHGATGPNVARLSSLAQRI